MPEALVAGAVCRRIILVTAVAAGERLTAVVFAPVCVLRSGIDRFGYSLAGQAACHSADDHTHRCAYRPSDGSERRACRGATCRADSRPDWMRSRSAGDGIRIGISLVSGFV
jgi:hypothetical protein